MRETAKLLHDVEVALRIIQIVIKEFSLFHRNAACKRTEQLNRANLVFD